MWIAKYTNVLTLPGVGITLETVQTLLRLAFPRLPETQHRGSKTHGVGACGGGIKYWPDISIGDRVDGSVFSWNGITWQPVTVSGANRKIPGYISQPLRLGFRGDSNAGLCQQPICFDIQSLSIDSAVEQDR